QARRYHWLSEGLTSFVDDPHSAIDGEPRGEIINLADRRAAPSRAAQLDLIARGPDAVLAGLGCVAPAQPGVVGVPASAQGPLPHLQMPAHHDVRPTDVFLRRVHATLAAAAENGPADFADLLLQPGVGARTVEALAAVAEIVHGAPCRFADPARFSLAHGGKDGHPFPVPLRVYDRTISVLKHAVEQAKLGREERLGALRRLDDQARRIESRATGPDLEVLIETERERSPSFGGRDVSGPARGRQLALPLDAPLGERRTSTV
ncbi:MAG: DUF763 domain-containing protein, partial [Myxococcales bacterium]